MCKSGDEEDVRWLRNTFFSREFEGVVQMREHIDSNFVSVAIEGDGQVYCFANATEAAKVQGRLKVQLKQAKDVYSRAMAANAASEDTKKAKASIANLKGNLATARECDDVSTWPLSNEVAIGHPLSKVQAFALVSRALLVLRAVKAVSVLFVILPLQLLLTVALRPAPPPGVVHVHPECWTLVQLPWRLEVPEGGRGLASGSKH